MGKGYRFNHTKNRSPEFAHDMALRGYKAKQVGEAWGIGTAAVSAWLLSKGYFDEADELNTNLGCTRVPVEQHSLRMLAIYMCERFDIPLNRMAELLEINGPTFRGYEHRHNRPRLSYIFGESDVSTPKYDRSGRLQSSLETARIRRSAEVRAEDHP